MSKYEQALTFSMDFTRARDSVDRQFDSLWEVIAESAIADAYRGSHPNPPSRQHIKVATLLFRAWHRTVYFRSSKFGGVLFAYSNAEILYWLRLFCARFLGLRDVEHQHWDAGNLCSMMRADKEAKILGVKSALFYGLPFDGIMSWDLSNLLSASLADESLYFATKPLSQWQIKATGDGTVVDLAQRLEVANIDSIILRARRA